MPSIARVRRPSLALTMGLLLTVALSLTIASPAQAADKPKSDRLAGAASIYGRSVELHIDYVQSKAWAKIGSGDPTDEIWLDLSYDGGETIADERLGYTTIPADSRSTETALFSIKKGDQGTPVVRACGKAGNVADIICTDWVGDEPPPSPTTSPARGAADALLDLYNADTGLFATTGWWNNANALTAVIDYAQATGDDRYDWIIANTYEKNIDEHYGNFTNEYIDDTGWWSLAWIRAYDYTGEERYLEMAKTTADYMWTYHDDVCGGGLWWRSDKQYKNAVTNELFIKAAAELHNRIPGDTTYLSQAVDTWNWFEASGMINDDNLINDGLTLDTCASNKQTTWTYNQGIVLGGLTALHKATADDAYLERAKVLADASIADRLINPKGVLTEPCEAGGGDCGGDGPTFKGVYVRNLAELTAATQDNDYRRYLARQARVSYRHDRNDYNQYGVHWAGPFTGVNGATQTSAFEAQTAPIRANG